LTVATMPRAERVTALTALADAFVSADQEHVPPEFLCSALDTATQLMADEHPDLASKCARVNRGIRESRGWNISEDLEATSRGVSEPESALAEIVAGWRAFQRSMQSRGSGTVTRLLNEGSGFIRGDDGVDRYFSLPRGFAMPDWLVEGASVTFRPIQRLDRKAGVEKPAADSIEAAQPRFAAYGSNCALEQRLVIAQVDGLEARDDVLDVDHLDLGLARVVVLDQPRSDCDL
jgi:hypothetical protein